MGTLLFFNYFTIGVFFSGMNTSDILATTFHWDFKDIIVLILTNVVTIFAWPIIIGYFLVTK